MHQQGGEPATVLDGEKEIALPVQRERVLPDWMADVSKPKEQSSSTKTPKPPTPAKKRKKKKIASLNISYEKIMTIVVLTEFGLV